MARLPRGFSLRSAAIVVALVLAAVATIALSGYVQSVEDRALEDVELVEAFVAKDTIPRGMSGSGAVAAGLVDRAEVLRRTLPAGAITRLDQIAELVTTTDILPGELLLSGRFVDAAAATGELTIPEQHVAMSVEVGVPPGIAGFVDSGDRVSIIAHVAGGPADPEAAAAGDSRSAFLLQDVLVLSVGQRLVETGGEGQSGQVERSDAAMLLTLAVTPDQAERLSFAVFEGSLYFTLLPDDEEVGAPGSRVADTGGRTRDNLFDR